MLPKRRFVRLLAGFVILAGTLTLTGESKKAFTRHDKAFYLSPEQVAFVRPGIVLKITSGQIASDGTMTATFKITDPKGLPLDIAGVTTPGPVTVRLTAAYIPNDGKQYVSYVTRVQKSPITGNSAAQPTLDSGGTFQQIGDGTYTYTFKAKAPAGFDVTATHTIAGQAERNLADFKLGTQGTDAVFTFRPDGAKVTNTRDVVATSACNQCHDPLAMHGGARQDVEYCVVCHTAGVVDPDTGNSVDLKVMVHKIHAGPNLPSVKAGGKYQIIGFNQSVSDFSGTTFPRDVRQCDTCHQQGKDAPAHADAFATNPSRAACGSCHDNVNFATGEGHLNLPQSSDAHCSQCHIPQGDTEFDASVMGAHTVPALSAQLPGVIYDITKVDHGTAGGNPTVTFTIKDKAGHAIDIKTMDRVALVLAGPTSDYPAAISEDASKATGSDGTYMYTFKYQIPADATGNWSMGIEGTKTITLNPGTTLELKQRDGGINKVVSFSVDGGPMQPRRTVVALNNCNSCHGSLSVHGGNRNQIEMCVLCHNPNGNDGPMRAAAQNPVQTIDFRTMIHKIHTGENLTSDFTIMGFGHSVNKFNDVTFPGDRRDCAKCHVNDSEQLPLSPNLLSVATPRDYLTTTPPTAAACLACHTTKAAASHAMSNMSSLGESCDVCHGKDAQFSVDQVHAR